MGGRVLRLSKIRYQSAIGVLMEWIVVTYVEETSGRITYEAGVACMAIADASSANGRVACRYVQRSRHFVAILTQMVHILISGSCVGPHRVFRHW